VHWDPSPAALGARGLADNLRSQLNRMGVEVDDRARSWTATERAQTPRCLWRRSHTHGPCTHAALRVHGTRAHSRPDSPRGPGAEARLRRPQWAARRRRAPRGRAPPRRQPRGRRQRRGRRQPRARRRRQGRRRRVGGVKRREEAPRGTTHTPGGSADRGARRPVGEPGCPSGLPRAEGRGGERPGARQQAILHARDRRGVGPAQCVAGRALPLALWPARWPHTRRGTGTGTGARVRRSCCGLVPFQSGTARVTNPLECEASRPVTDAGRCPHSPGNGPRRLRRLFLQSWSTERERA